MGSKSELLRYWDLSGIIEDKKVIDAFRSIPRELFIGSGEDAYGDHPLPIGEGQTISQPTTVMIMTQALELAAGQKVLEVGTGSGYQAALIAHIVGRAGKVVTTEIVPKLAQFAKKNLRGAGIRNVEVICHDGSKGYDEQAPYDRIMITAAAPYIPKSLIDQLKDRGIVVAPVGPIHLGQEMKKITKLGSELKEKNLGEFVFVPLKGKFGY